jgi:SM-20-related protein
MLPLNPLFEQIIADLLQKDFAVIEFLFDSVSLRNLKEGLLAKIAFGKLQQAGIGNRKNFAVNNPIRSDTILWLENDSDEVSEKYFLAKTQVFCDYLNETCYLGIKSFEFHYASYERGAFYKRHLDRFKNDDSRKFSIITYLNEDWTSENGGELVLYPENEIIKILPIFGRTVIFRSDLLEHEVLLGLRDRLSITGWLK